LPPGDLDQAAGQGVFPAFHDAPVGRFQIIITGQVEQTMDDISAEFFRPGCPPFCGLFQGVGDTDETLAMQVRLRGAVVEGDDVRAAFVAEVIPIEPRHFLGADEVDADLSAAAQLFEGGAGQGLDGGARKGLEALSVADLDG